MLEVSFASLSRTALAGIASSGRSLYNGSTHKSSSSLSNASSSLRVVAKLAFSLGQELNVLALARPFANVECIARP